MFVRNRLRRGEAEHGTHNPFSLATECAFDRTARKDEGKLFVDRADKRQHINCDAIAFGLDHQRTARLPLDPNGQARLWCCGRRHCRLRLIALVAQGFKHIFPGQEALLANFEVMHFDATHSARFRSTEANLAGLQALQNRTGLHSDLVAQFLLALFYSVGRKLDCHRETNASAARQDGTIVLDLIGRCTGDTVDSHAIPNFGFNLFTFRRYDETVFNKDVTRLPLVCYLIPPPIIDALLLIIFEPGA